VDGIVFPASTESSGLSVQPASDAFMESMETPQFKVVAAT